MRTKLLLIFLVFYQFLQAQNKVESIISEILKNNINLIAVKKAAEAENVGYKTGIYLKNPELEFDYLFGSPSAIGNKTDIAISQEFDFPTAYGHRKKLAESNILKSGLSVKKTEQEIVRESLKKCIELIALNASKNELSRQLNQATNLVEIFKTKLEKGEGNILDFNKAKLNKIEIESEIEQTEIERNKFLSDLESLNGGNTVILDDTSWVPKTMINDFDSWFQQIENKIPGLEILKQEKENSALEEKLAKSLSLPKFKAGYKSEKVTGEHFQGLNVGITIPLWENKNTVKYAKAKTESNQLLIDKVKKELYLDLKNKYLQINSTKKTLDKYKEVLSSINHAELLNKALQKGEMPLLNYLTEMMIFNQSRMKILELTQTLNLLYTEFEIYF